MAMILNKCLNNDVCDEINKRVVNDTIKDLRNENENLQYENEDLEDKLEKRDDEIDEYNNDNGLLEDRIAELEPGNICRTLTVMNNRNYNFKFDSYMDVCDMSGLAWDIADTYDNFDEWYGDILHHYLDYVVDYRYSMDSSFFNITIDHIFEAREYHEESYGDFIIDTDKAKFSKMIIFLLLKKEFEGGLCIQVEAIICDMREWYDTKIEEEKEDPFRSSTDSDNE